MSEENKKKTAEKAVETPKNEEIVATTPVVEKTPVIEEVKTKKTPKKRIKKVITPISIKRTNRGFSI